MWLAVAEDPRQQSQAVGVGADGPWRRDGPSLRVQIGGVQPPVLAAVDRGGVTAMLIIERPERGVDLGLANATNEREVAVRDLRLCDAISGGEHASEGLVSSG